MVDAAARERGLAMVGRHYPFNPRGSQFSYPGYPAEPPTTIKMSALGIGPGDYIGLRGSGSWQARPGDPQKRMSGMFRSGTGGRLAPAPSGQEKEFKNWDFAPDPSKTKNFQEDFDIPYDKTTIVRVPRSAIEIVLNSGDWKFMDNSAGPDCGVLVTLPNKKKSEPLHASVKVTKGPDLEEAALDVDFSIHPPIPSPGARYFSRSPFKAAASVDSRPQWRGWYEGSGWKPDRSYWNGRGGTHKGWDIFAPTGSKLIAPVGPCWLEFLPGENGGFGNITAFFFSKSGKEYVAIYAHCSSFIGAGKRQIAMGEEVAFSGCSGSTVGPQCGTELPKGGRIDHVHVGLYEGQLIKDSPPGKPIDPATFFDNWSFMPIEAVHGAQRSSGAKKRKTAKRKVPKQFKNARKPGRQPKNRKARSQKR
jgi:hypothetical protein